MVGVPMLKPVSFSCPDPKLSDAQTRKQDAIKHRRARGSWRRAGEAHRRRPRPRLPAVPGARLVEREVVRDGRTVWVEEWRVTVSSVGELLELQSGLGAPIVIDGSRLTVMARGA